MKRTIVLVAFLLAGISESGAQSESFQALQKKFSSNESVFTFSTSGVLARTVLWLAGEHEFKRAIKQVKSIRLITIPATAFEQNKVSVAGFKKVVAEDAYEQLALVRDRKDEVTLYVQALKNSSVNRYLILIDNPEEVVAVEIKGYIEPNLLNSPHGKVSYQDRNL